MVNDEYLFSDKRVTPRDVTGIRFERQFGDKKEKNFEINPEENKYIEFKRGYLVVYCSHELDVKDKIRLYLNKWMGLTERDLYYIDQKGLKKIVNSGFPFIYHTVVGSRINPKVKARKSLLGELEVKLKKEEGGLEFKMRVVFSKREYNTIRDYVNALNLS